MGKVSFQKETTIFLCDHPAPKRPLSSTENAGEPTFDGEFGGVAVDANADPALIGGDVADAMWRAPAECWINDIMDANLLRFACALPRLAASLETAGPFLLFRVDGHRRIARRLVLRRHASGRVELSATIRMVAAFPGFARRLKAAVKLRQKVADTPPADWMTLPGPFLRKPRRALARPPQRRLRIAPGCRLNQRIKGVQQRRTLVGQPLAPAPFGADASLRGDAERRWRGRRQGRRRRQFLQTGLNRRSRHANGLGHRAHAAPPQTARFNAGPKTQRRFVQPPRQSTTLLFDHPRIFTSEPCRINETAQVVFAGVLSDSLPSRSSYAG